MGEPRVSKVEFGEMHESGIGPDGHFFQRTFPFWACGHCSDPHVMRRADQRPTHACVYCTRFICPDKPICHAQCTPLYSLADDKFETKGPWADLVPAIMTGAINVPHTPIGRKDKENG